MSHANVSSVGGAAPSPDLSASPPNPVLSPSGALPLRKPAFAQQRSPEDMTAISQQLTLSELAKLGSSVASHLPAPADDNSNGGGSDDDSEEGSSSESSARRNHRRRSKRSSGGGGGGDVHRLETRIHYLTVELGSSTAQVAELEAKLASVSVYASAEAALAAFAAATAEASGKARAPAVAGSPIKAPSSVDMLSEADSKAASLLTHRTKAAAAITALPHASLRSALQRVIVRDAINADKALAALRTSAWRTRVREGAFTASWWAMAAALVAISMQQAHTWWTTS